MASLTSKFSLKSLVPGSGGVAEHNPLTMSDDQILEHIISTHVHSDTKFDVAPLFSLVDNTLTRSTHIVDSVVQVHFLFYSLFDYLNMFLYVKCH